MSHQNDLLPHVIKSPTSNEVALTKEIKHVMMNLHMRLMKMMKLWSKNRQRTRIQRKSTNSRKGAE